MSQVQQPTSATLKEDGFYYFADGTRMSLQEYKIYLKRQGIDTVPAAQLKESKGPRTLLG